MNKFKNVFCLFLFIISFIYSRSLFNDIDIVDSLLKKDKLFLFTTITNKNFNNPVSLLSVTNKETPVKEKEIESNTKTNSTYSKPKVYIFNSHQTEEYKSNVYSITPTVVTASNILHDELKSLGIFSIVETKDVIKEVNRRGLDYSGTYTVSFENLKSCKNKNPSLEYFFDMHRDSVTGDAARTVINGKKYATIMFLVGANHDKYKNNLKNVRVMESYLKKNYPGLLRDTYIQKLWTYNQWYSPKMFLVELGGPDNTLEEVYNTAKALSEAIKYYMEA